MSAKLLQLYGRNVLMHLGAVLGAFAPYLVQLATARLGWTVATAASSGVIATWLAAHAHVSGKLANTVGAELGSIASKAAANPSGLMQDLEAILGGFLGGHAGGGVPAAPPTGSAPMAPPPGLGGILPCSPVDPAAGNIGPHTPGAGSTS